MYSPLYRRNQGGCLNSMSLHLILQRQKTYRNKIKKLTKSKNCYSITITARQSLKSEITMVEFFSFFFFNPFFFPPMQINRRDLQLENMRILTNLCVWMSPREKHHFCCKSNSRYQPASNSPYITKLSIQKKIKFRKRKSFTNFLEHSVLFPWAENTLITLKDRNTSLELDWGNRKFWRYIYAKDRKN